MHKDEQGLPLTATSAEAVSHFNDAVRDYAGFGNDAVTHIEGALEADPAFPLAHCLRGCFYMLMGTMALVPKARKCLDEAETFADGANEREIAHIAALRAWIEGDLLGTIRTWEEILEAHPTDVLALRFAYFMHFDLGDSPGLLGCVSRALPGWSEDRPGYGYILGMHAFGLEEASDYVAAEETGRRAIEINPADIWAVHAVAHVMEMQCRAREGIEWLTEHEPQWSGCNYFTHHVWWHAALFRIEITDYEGAFAIYDDYIREEESEIPLDMVDAASLLWRLELLGVDIGERWSELADKAAKRTSEHVLPFSDAHYMMALAAGGRSDKAKEMMTSMREYADVVTSTTAPVMKAVGIPACEAIKAFAEENYERTVDLLLPVRGEIFRIGGSHAQRDLFSLTLIEAALRSSRSKIADTLAHVRVTVRPRSPQSWYAYARALSAAGSEAEANTAHRRAGDMLEI